jgi:Flp pilus assembly protein TadD
MSAEQRLQEAIRAHEQGKLSVAKDLYQQVLQLQPGHPTVFANLAVIAIAEQKYELAEKYLRSKMIGPVQQSIRPCGSGDVAALLRNRG